MRQNSKEVHNFQGKVGLAPPENARPCPSRSKNLAWGLSYEILEIKPCGLGSRIRDMEAEWRLKVITDRISWRIFGKQNWH